MKLENTVYEMLMIDVTELVGLALHLKQLLFPFGQRERTHSQTADPSQRALQCVVVVFEALELQEVFGPLAALPSGRQVGDLDG